MRIFIRVLLALAGLAALAIVSFFTYMYLHGEEYVTSKAMRKADPSICGQIFEFPCGHRGCLASQCATKVVMEFKDENMCKTKTFFQYSSGQCYEDLAIAMKDPSFCSQVAYLSDECLLNVAKAKNDPALCASVVANKATCYGHFAAQNQDPSLCLNLEEQDGRELCASHYAEVGDVTVSFCERTFTGQTRLVELSNCFRRAARLTLDLSACAKIPAMINGEINHSQMNCMREIKGEIGVYNSLHPDSPIPLDGTGDMKKFQDQIKVYWEVYWEERF